MTSLAMNPSMLVPVSGQELPCPSNYAAYSRAVEAIPLLSASRESELFDRLKNAGDLGAAKELVLSHLRMVLPIAREHAGYGLAREDLIQEGNVGLMKAVRGFNPTLGARLCSYAAPWIRAEIQEFILANWRLVKIGASKALRKLFFNLRSLQEKLHGRSRLDQKEEIAKLLGVSETEVESAAEWFAGGEAALLGGPSQEDGTPSLDVQSDWATPEEHVEQADWESKVPKLLSQALKDLPERDRVVVEGRFLSIPTKSLAELAGELAVSIERVRQIEAGALKKLKQALPALDVK